MKKTARIIFGAIVGLVLLALSLRGVHPDELWEAMRSASPLLILASIFVGVVIHGLFRAMRWRVMLSPEKKRIGLYNLFSTTLIGYAVTFALPMRLGEVLRPVLLAERENIRASAALTTVVLERFLDGLAVLALFALALTFWDGQEALGAQGEQVIALARAGGILMLVMSGLLMAAFLVAEATRKKWEPRLEAFAERTSNKLLRSVARAIVGLVEGGAILRSPGGLLMTGVLSIAVWVAIGFSTWLGLGSAGVWLRFEETFILLPAAVLGIAVPTPGGAGSYEIAVSRALHHLFGQPLSEALAATLILHVVITLLPVVLLGLALVWYDGVSLARIRAGFSSTEDSAETAEDAPAAAALASRPDDPAAREGTP